jgi:predicted ABC-type ATPase
LVAGPNGSGKSTLTASLFPSGSIPIIDPDAIARELNPERPDRAATGAAREAILQHRALIGRLESFVVESTLAGHGVFSLLANARRAGYRIQLIYLALRDVELHIERVRLRVSLGGHDVPDAAIRRRYAQSLANLPEALRQADEATVYDNSYARLTPLMKLNLGQVRWRAESLPDWAHAIVAGLE